MQHALITGAAGFIGSHLVDRLLADGWRVTAVDNFDPFYPRAVKDRNIAEHLRHPNYRLVDVDIRDLDALRQQLSANYSVIVHLAARAGVRPSILDPIGYQDVNVKGTQNLLELAKELGVPQFVFASSSSVYGVNPNVPWSEEDHVLLPISPYASTKVSGELLGHVYSHLYDIRFVALRFFTVYGPRQRPDLAIHKFARRMAEGQSIPVFGDGSMRRDYTFIDDIVAGIRGAMDYSGSPFEVINLGNNETVTLLEMIRGLEQALGREAKIDWQPEQPGDVPQTWANVDKAQRLLGYQPTTAYRDGVVRFVEWLGSLQDAPGRAVHLRPEQCGSAGRRDSVNGRVFVWKEGPSSGWRFGSASTWTACSPISPRRFATVETRLFGGTPTVAAEAPESRPSRKKRRRGSALALVRRRARCGGGATPSGTRFTGPRISGRR